MPLTLKNYSKELTKDLLQQAEKNQVRECDETQKGHFVAYVDEGNDTFDVSITILPDGAVGKSTCDCKTRVPFCRHKAALLVHIAGNKKTASVKISKKENQTETLLDQVEFSGLKDWVKNLVEKNKDIELAFIQHFSAKKQSYTTAEVSKLIKDAIKATIGSKRTIDNTQLKRLVELWGDVLEPVVAYYHANVVENTAFQSFHTLMDDCLQFQSGVSGGNTRISKYVNETLLRSIAPVNNLINDEAWIQATSFFVNNILINTYGVRLHYLQHLQNIIAAEVSSRKEKLIGLIADVYEKSKPQNMHYGSYYTKAIFGIIESNGLFSCYYKLFKPISFDNDYNEKLISLLIENNQLELAKKYCDDQIAGNYREEFSVSYLKFLKEIYTLEKNEEKIAAIKKQLLPYTLNFDDYLFTIGRLDAEEAKKFRTKMLTKARSLMRDRKDGGAEFVFRLFDHEKNYRKLIESIESGTPYSVMLKYFEPMVSADKIRLIEAIAKKREDSSYSYSRRAADDPCFPELYAAVLKYYKPDFLKLLIKENEKPSGYYNPGLNSFMAYMKEQLAND